MESSRHHISKNPDVLIAAIFYSYSSTLCAYAELLENGCKHTEVSMVMSLDTWRALFLTVLGGVDVEHPKRKRLSLFPEGSNHHQLPAKIKALICTSSIMSGMEFMIAGPLSSIHLQEAINTIDISKIFQKWGLPISVSVNYEEEILCGGIMMGSQCPVKLQGKPALNGFSKHAHAHVGKSAIIA